MFFIGEEALERRPSLRSGLKSGWPERGEAILFFGQLLGVRVMSQRVVGLMPRERSLIEALLEAAWGSIDDAFKALRDKRNPLGFSYDEVAEFSAKVENFERFRGICLALSQGLVSA